MKRKYSVQTLSDLEKDILIQNFKCLAEDVPENEKFFIQHAQFIADLLPIRIINSLIEFKQQSNFEGYWMMQNCPQDILPPTPLITNIQIEKKTYYSEFILATIGEILGGVVGYKQEKNGKIFSWIYPTKENSKNLSSESSQINLDIHTEMVFLKSLSPHFVLLFGHRQDHEKVAYTSVCSIKKVLHYLTQNEIDILKGKNFRTGIDYSFGAVNGLRGIGPITSVLYGENDCLKLSLDYDLMQGLTHEAHQIFLKLSHLFIKHKEEIKLGPGMLLVIDNRFAVHGRSPFKPRYDGHDRLLQRTLVHPAFQRTSHRIIYKNFRMYV